MLGEVRAYHQRGFGFLRYSGARELFFHANDCEPRGDGTPKSFPTGTLVEFELGTDTKGRPVAKNMRIVEPEYSFGTIKFFTGAYGFIVPDDGGEDVHFGKGQVVGESTTFSDEGDRVMFFRSVGDEKGPEAYHVELAEFVEEEATEEWSPFSESEKKK